MSRDFPPRCYYCDFNPFANADSYEHHIVTKHVGLPGYPSPGDLKFHKLKPQHMYWEKTFTDQEIMERLRLYIPVSERIKHYRKTAKPTREMWS